MWVWLSIIGSLLLIVGAIVFVHARRTHAAGATPRDSHLALWSSHWLAIGSISLGLLLIATAVLVQGTPARNASDVGDTTPGGQAPESADDREDPDISGQYSGSDQSGESDGSGPGAGKEPISDVNVYRMAVIDVNNEIGRQLGELTARLVEARYEDETWRAETESILSAMKSAADTALTVTPTQEYEAAHAVWMEGIESYAWAAENMAVAIQGPDYDLMNECTARMESASASFKQSMVLMQEVNVP